jgi:hypothetical protein
LVTSTLTRSQPDVVVFYPRDSLAQHLAAWNGRHLQYRIEQSFAKDLPNVCKVLRGAPVVVIDVTDDPSQALGVFSQIVRRLGPYSVLVYTEQMHNGLELFVRGCGVLLLWGPLSDMQWDDLLQRTFASTNRTGSATLRAGKFSHAPLRTTAGLKFQRLCEEQFSAGSLRPKTGVK